MPAVPTLAFEKYTACRTDSKSILVEDKRLPLVTVNTWYHVGPGGRKRRTHRLRAPVRAHDVPGIEERAGRQLHPATSSRRAATSTARPISIAPTTSRPLPSNQLELALWLESDRMGYLLEDLDQEKLTNQQDVVRNERRQSVREPPLRTGRRGGRTTRCFPRGIRTTRRSSARMPTSRRRSWPTCAISSASTTRPTTPAW